MSQYRKKQAERELKKQRRREEAMSFLRSIMGGLSRDDIKAINQARKRAGLAPREIKKSHAGVMAHLNVIFKTLGYKREPGSRRMVLTTPDLSHVGSSQFLETYEWRKLRYEFLLDKEARCAACGRTPQEDGIRIQIDHILPRKLRPDLALDKSNLQILCHECNHGKANWDTTDWGR